MSQVLTLAERCPPSPPRLHDLFAQVGDPRARRGVRHRFVTILTLAVCAVLAGACSFVAVAEWAADLDPNTRAELGLSGPAPSESTFRRVLQKLDADVFDALLGRWTEGRTAAGGGRRRHVAVDSKTLRGSGGMQARPVTCWPRSTTTTASCSGRSMSARRPPSHPGYPPCSTVST